MQIITAFIHFKFTNDVPIVFVLKKTVSLEVLSEFLNTRPTENEAWSVFFKKRWPGLGRLPWDSKCEPNVLIRMSLLPKGHHFAAHIIVRHGCPVKETYDL